MRQGINLSLHARLLLAASIVLALFLGATGWALDRAFHEAAERALRERLQAYLYTLLAAAELDKQDRMQLPPDLPEPRLGLPGSGLYAELARTDGGDRWHSRSALGLKLEFSARPAVGERLYETLAGSDGKPLYALSQGIAWPDSRGATRHYVFRVAEHLEGFNRQITAFRQSLWGWLAGAALLLLAVQGLILRWGLKPLRTVATDLARIEAGDTDRLRGDYPKELRGLTDNLNTLLASTHAHLARYRDALGNLAHSLKTPLAVLRGALGVRGDDTEKRKVMEEQIERMRELIEFQLARAAMAGRAALSAPIPVAPHAEKIVRALSRVYADKPVRTTVDVDGDVTFHGDEGDLTELLGNLADNAFKWCREQVAVRARRISDAASGPRLEIIVEDDGPGIAPEEAERLTKRGARGDTSVAGQGIGLAVVRDTVTLYGGELGFARSALGGTAVTVRL
jgi:two-component system sensor histidine kinase PhoQ